jgi:DNA-binding NtrC family response regulator
MAEHTILVVSEDAARLGFLTTVLQRAGYRTIGASSAAAGVEATGSGAEHLHLIVTDRTLDDPESATLQARYPMVPVLVVDDAASGELLAQVRRRLARTPEERT